MAHRLVEAAVRARLTEGFTAADVYVEGLYDTPKDQRAFVVLQFPFNENQHRTIGAPGGAWYWEDGGFRIVLNVKRKGGTLNGIPAGRLWADEIATLFRGAEFEGIRCLAPSSPISDDSNDEGGYFVLAFVVPYQFQFQQEG